MQEEDKEKDAENAKKLHNVINNITEEAAEATPASSTPAAAV